MRIMVENFGPIRKASDIFIAPLTFFVGPSNSGKSYLAAVINSTFEAADECFVDPVPEIDDSKMKDKAAEDFFTAWAESMQQIWKERIAYYLGEEGQNIAKSRSMRVTVSSDDGNIVIDLCKPKKSSIPRAHLNNLVVRARKQAAEYDDDFPPIVKTCIGLVGELYVELCGNAWARSYCLPAVRGAVMQNYRSLVDQSIRRASEFGARNGNASPMFSGILGNFARQLIGIDKKEKGGKEIIAINKILESNILHGRINVIFPDIGLPEFRYAMKGKKGDMAINNVSGMVAELAPLSVFMRYYLNAKNLLIWEEPEMNLYPQAQRDIADIMVRLANAGVFVLATTHSDIILEQIGNAIHAADIKSKKPSAKIKLLGKNGQTGALLERKNATVYSFARQTRGGTEVRKLPFSGAAGFVPKEYMKISEDLYNETVTLFNQK